MQGSINQRVAGEETRTTCGCSTAEKDINLERPFYTVLQREMFAGAREIEREKTKRRALRGGD